MTAEFDSSGFSAIDKFFGANTEKAVDQKSSNGLPTAGSRGKRRGGVGVRSDGKDSHTKTLSSDLLAKQVLRVGKKRHNDNSNDDADEGFDADSIDDHGIHDTDADGGRTSITKSKAAISKGSSGKDKESKAKKKLGKKERERQKHVVQKETVEANAKQEHQSSSTVIAASTNDKTDDGSHHANDKPQRTKRKRKKVRSRQKNIRKDNRSVDEKPDYLIPGSENYQGRPMTPATREKLNLPPRKKKQKSEFRKNIDTNSSLFVIDRNPDSAGDDVGVKLAIDEFMETVHKGDTNKNGPLNTSRDKVSQTVDRKKSSKKKKKRYKNLA